MIRFAIYARYSTELQNPKSADDQIDEIRADVARRHPHWVEVEGAFKDEGVSGRTIFGRRAFQEILALAGRRDRPLDAILVEDISRAFRNREEAARTRADLRRLGVKILSMAEGYVDPDSEEGFWLGAIKEVKAEADSREISKRTRRGQRKQTERGYIAGRPINFGYRRKPVYDAAVKDRDGQALRLGVALEPDPAAAAAVRAIFSLFTERGFGFKRIAHFLNDPTSEFASLKPRGFCPTFVRSILLNTVYVGDMVFGVRTFYRTPDGQRRYRLNPEDQRVVRAGAHPALIDRETFERVQAIIGRRRGTRSMLGPVRSEGRTRHLLSGILRCGVCGGQMIARASTGRPDKDGSRRKYRYYVCGHRARRGPTVCSNAFSLTIEEVDRWVLDTVDSYVLDEKAIAFVETERRRILEEAIEARLRTESAAHEELRKIEKEIANLIEGLKAGLPAGAIRGELERLEERKRELRGQVAAVENLQSLLHERLDRQLAANRLRRSREVLGSENAFLVREELAKHILEMTAAADGSVRLVTRKHSLFGDLERVLGSDFGEGKKEPNDPLRTRVVAGAAFEPATSGS